ncbi:MAG: YckD family protein [Bacillota bacterium]
MRKGLVITLVALLVLALAAPALAAALTPEQSQEIAKIHQQILDLRKQLIDKYVAYGRLTPEQGQQIKARIEARQKFLQENPDYLGNCPGCGLRAGRGFGAGQGSGAGLRGAMGGRQWQNNTAPPTSS